MWLRMKIRIIRQRFLYLLRGNAQGVSMGYLNKSGSVILPAFEDLALRFPLVTQKDFEEGLRLYKTIVELQSGSIYPKNYDSGSKLNAFLYSYIKAYSPQVVVETGVANGITTNIITEALDNEQSVLHSFDVDVRTNTSYTGHKRWLFHLLKPPFHKNLKYLVDDLGPVDLWLHDSNHGGEATVMSML